MIDLHLPNDRAPVVLCLGAHCDDIEIGCGGTLLTLLAARNDVDVHSVVFSSNPAREAETRRALSMLTLGAANHSVEVLGYRNGYFPWVGDEIKDAFESLKAKVTPDIVFSHYRADRHQDHRVISDLTWNTFRDNLILEYEILKYDGDIASPNTFVELEPDVAQKKAEILYESFESQRSRQWFEKENFLALMRIRGVECASDFAEAFYSRKVKIGFP